MSEILSCRSIGGLLPAVFAVLVAGCGGPAAAPDRPVGITAEPVSTEPGAIELSEPKVTFTEPNLVHFEVHYRFTQGKPVKHYLCDVTFPGTPNAGTKPIENWELKPEGVIEDGITLSHPPVTTFEIRISEADSPDAGFKLISNVVSGPVTPASAR